MENSQIVARFETLVTQRKTVDNVWDLIRRYVMPIRSDFVKEIRSEHSVEWRQNRNLFDSTAGQGLETLSSSLHGSLTSPATQWFELSFRDENLKKDKEANIWLENAANDVHGALQDSNFNLEISEAYIDLAGYGNAILIEEEDEEVEGKVVFQSSPIQDSWFEEDSKGQVTNFYRKFVWTPLQIIDKFGDKVPKKVKEAAKGAAQSNHKMDVIMCVFTRFDKKENRNSANVLAPKERPYGKKWLLKDGHELLGEEGGYYEIPTYVARWRKATGSQWGFGPSHLALPDILTANQLVEMILRATEKVVDPAVLVTERGLISDLDLGPAGLSVVRDMDSMQPFESRARFDVSELRLQALQDTIRSFYYVDQLQLKDSPAMTATEVQVRYELMQRLLGPTLGRLENDLLSPMIERTFNIRFRAGKFGQLPESLVQVGQDTAMDITYTGPLARAQKVDEAASIERWIGMVAELGQIHPESMDIPDWDEVLRTQAKLLGVPSKLTKSQPKVTAIRQKTAQMQAQQQQVAMQQAEGDAMKAQGEGQQAMQETA